MDVRTVSGNVGSHPEVDLLWRILGARLRGHDEQLEELRLLPKQVRELQEIVSAMIRSRGASGAVEFFEDLRPRTSPERPFLAALQEARQHLADTTAHFADLADRFDHFVDFKSACHSLVASLEPLGGRYDLEAADLLEDATRFCYAENLSVTQLETLSAVLDVLERGNLDQSDAIAVDRMLTAVGLYTIPEGTDE